MNHTAPSSPEDSSFAPCNDSQYTALPPQLSASWHQKATHHPQVQSNLHFHHYYHPHPSSSSSFYHEAATSKANSSQNPFPCLNNQQPCLFLLCMFKPNNKKSEIAQITPKNMIFTQKITYKTKPRFDYQICTWPTFQNRIFFQNWHEKVKILKIIIIFHVCTWIELLGAFRKT